jgi:hypothetical protein
MPTSAVNSGGGVSSSSYFIRSSIGQFAGGQYMGGTFKVLTGAQYPIDTDNDAIIDVADNCYQAINLDQLNNDMDTQGDVCDADDDNDGLTDIAEAGIGTDPFLFDTDNDRLNDLLDPDPLLPALAGDVGPYGAPDGVLNTSDIIVMRQFLLGHKTPDAIESIIGDIHPDGNINTADLLQLQQKVFNPN